MPRRIRIVLLTLLALNLAATFAYETVNPTVLRLIAETISVPHP